MKKRPATCARQRAGAFRWSGDCFKLLRDISAARFRHELTHAAAYAAEVVSAPRRWSRHEAAAAPARHNAEKRRHGFSSRPSITVDSQYYGRWACRRPVATVGKPLAASTSPRHFPSPAAAGAVNAYGHEARRTAASS